MSFRFHMKPVVAKPKPAVKPRAEKAPSKGPSAAKAAVSAESKDAAASADEDAPSAPPSADAVDNATPAEQPGTAVGRTRTVSYRSQDESASSADESRRPKVVSRLVKARIKPSIPGAKKTPLKGTQPETAPASATKTISEAAEALVLRQNAQTPVQVRCGPDFKPSPHLVPAAPNCVPSHTELSSSEDEGVIDPYNPDHPLGHRENPEKCRGTKSPWIMKKFRSGVPTAMIDYLFYNPKGNPMVHDDDKVLEPEKRLEEEADDLDDPEEEPEPQVAAPQLKLGPDGKFILDDTSLVVETTAAREGRKAMQSGVGAGFLKRRSNRTTWTDEETVFFYKCLNSVGTDFAMMTRFFPSRTRHQIKLKFKLEEKRHPMLVDKALGNNAHYDVSELELEFLDVSENAAKTRAQKRKPKEPKPKEKKTAVKKSRQRSRKNRKDYFLEDASTSGDESSSEDENDASLREEMTSSMAGEGGLKRVPRRKSLQARATTGPDGSPRFAFLEVVPNSGTSSTRPINPNALSDSQVNQLIGQRTDRDQLRYGNSELAFLLNSPTIREKENEKKKSPMKTAAVRRIVLEDSVEKNPSEQPAVNPPTPQDTLTENNRDLNPSITRPAVQQIKMLLNKRLQEGEESAASQVAQEGNSAEISVPASADPLEAGEEEEEMSDEDEMECLARSFLRPTKSGRVPKLREVESSEMAVEPKPKKPRKTPVRQQKKPRGRPKSKDSQVEEPQPTDNESANSANQEFDMQSILANAEPGSLVVIKTAVPNEPGKEMVQVFMVPPQDQSGTTVAHNPDGSVSQITINGVDMPFVPGAKIGPANLVPIVAATSGSSVIHSWPLETPDEPKGGVQQSEPPSVVAEM